MKHNFRQRLISGSTQFLIAFFLSIIAFSAFSQTIITTQICPTNPPDFSKLSYEEASSAVGYEEGKTIGLQYLTNLANEIRNPNLSSDKKVLAIYLLGTFRPDNANAIEALIEYIDLKATKFDPKTSIIRWGNYPTYEALIRIGQPAVIPIMNHLSTEDKPLRRHFMCGVLQWNEWKKGGKHDYAAATKIVTRQIESRLAEERDSAKRSHFEAALNELENPLKVTAFMPVCP